MSKLVAVRQAFKTNPDFSVVAVEEGDSVLEPQVLDLVNHVVEFLVAPNTPLSTHGEVNYWLPKLVPDLGSKWFPCVWSEEEKCTTFGYILVDEIIGTYTISTSHSLDFTLDDLTVDDLGAAKELHKYTQRRRETKTQMPLTRQIVVRLYPDREYAERASKGIDRFSARVHPFPTPPIPDLNLGGSYADQI